MEQPDTSQIMIVLAIATPVLGMLVLIVCAQTARDTGQPISPSMRRSAILLMVIGPLNLLLWLLLNRWLDTIGYRSVLGYAIAALVFFSAGWGTGFFARLRPKAEKSEPALLKSDEKEN